MSTLTGFARVRYSCRAVWTLIDDLDAFYLEHRRCGRLDTGIEGGCVWMTCEGCGERIVQLLGAEIQPSDGTRA